MEKRHKIVERGLILLGALMLLSPWLAGFDGGVAAVSARAMGSLFLLLGLLGLWGLRNWSEAGGLSAGAWAMMAPTVLGFLDNPAAAAVHVACGLAVIALPILGRDRRPQPPEMLV